MDCKTIREKLPLYIDGGLEQDDMKQVEAHLDSCVSCKSEYEDYMHIRGTLLDMSEVALPKTFKAFSVSNIEQYEKTEVEEVTVKSKILQFKWKRWTAIAAVFIVGLFSYSMLHDMNPRDYTDQLNSGTENAAPSSDNVDSDDMDISMEYGDDFSDDTGGANIEPKVSKSQGAASSTDASNGTAKADETDQDALDSRKVPALDAQEESAMEDIAEGTEDALTPENENEILSNFAPMMLPTFDEENTALIAETFPGYEYQILEENILTSDGTSGKPICTEYKIMFTKDTQGNIVSETITIKIENGKVSVVVDEIK